MKSRIFLITFTVANLGLILYGVLALIQPGILLEPFLTHVYQFPDEANQATIYLSGLYRLLGYLNILPGMLGLFFLYRFWVARQVLYMKIVVASTILTYIGPIIFDNTVGTIGFFEILEHILLAMIIIIGFFMMKNPEEGS